MLTRSVDGQTYAVTVSATDKAGNATSSAGSVTADETASLTIERGMIEQLA